MPFDVDAAFAAAAKGKLDPAAMMAPSAPPPAPAGDQESSVIDVGGPRYSPSIPAGQQGSQVNVTPGAAGAAPPDEKALTSPPPAPPSDAPPPKFNVDSAFALAKSGKLDPKAFAQSQAPAPPADQMQPLPPAPDSTAAPQQAPGSVTKSAQQGADDPNRPMSWSDVPKVFLGSTGAALDGIQRGLLGDKVTSGINAAVQTPFRMASGWQGPGAAFNEGYDADQKQHQAQQDKYPIADVGGQVEGAVYGATRAAPMLGLRAVTTPGLIPKIGAFGSYLARNMGFGAAMSEASGDDPTTGAGLAAILPAAHMLGSGTVRALEGGANAVANKIGPIIGGESGKMASIGRKLNQELPGGVGSIQSSPVGPYTLAQATGDPRIAAMQEVAKPFNPSAMAGMQGRQQSAIQQQIGKIGTASSTPESAVHTVDTVKAASQAAEDHETALWNKRELGQTPIPTQPIKDAVKSALQDLPFGLKLGISGNVKNALEHLNSAPDHLSVSDLNSVRTAFRLAGRPTESNPQASAVAATLGHATTDAMDRTLMTTPSIPPVVRQQWHEAREYTRALRTGPLAHSQIEPMLKSDKPGEVGARAFSFGTGQSSGAEALAGVTDFIKRVPNGAQLSADVIQATRNQIASAAQEAANTGNGTLQKFLQKNAHWLKSSGVLDQPQIEAVTQLQDYVDALQKPGELLKGAGSATYDRGKMSENFINRIMSPLQKLGLTVGLSHTHGGIGAILAHGANHVIEAVEGSLKSMTSASIADSEIAKDYMMKASRGNLAMMKPKSRDLYLQAQSAINNVLAQEVSPSNPSLMPPLNPRQSAVQVNP